MILEVLLVFTVNGGPMEMSDRVFDSFEECSEFVNAVAQQPVVNSDYGFDFLSVDGLKFEGQCIEMKDWQLKKKQS